MAAVLTQSAMLALPSAVNAQFTSGGWSYNRTVTINPTGTTTAVTNFPVLVRLNGKIANGGNSSDSLVFATAQSTGYDIRFSQTGYTDSVPFEIERYDPVNLYAEFWVLLPSVAAAGTPTTFKMYFGNAGVSGSPSNPAAIWTNANGFGLVYHMNYATDSSATDVGHSGLTGTLNGTITENAGTTSSAIGYGETFDGATGYYAGPTASTSPPNFQYQWTVSGWFYLNGSGNIGGGVLYKGALGAFHNYSTVIWFGNATAASDAVTGAGSHPCAMFNSGVNPNGNLLTTDTLTWNAWHHVVWQYQGTGSASTSENIYVDGSPQSLSSATIASANADYAATNFYVGVGSSRQTYPYYNGAMDELRIDSTYRSADWISLCFQTQMPPSVGTGAVSLSPFSLGPAAPTLVSPSNNTGSLSTTGVSLSWTSGGGPAVTSYEVQVAINAGFSSTVFDFSGVAITSQALPALAAGTIYYWRADAAGPTGVSNWSGAWSFSTIAPLGPPPLAAPTNGAGNLPISLNLSWIGVTGAVSYSLQVSTSSGFGSTVVGQSGIAATTKGVSLANATTYYWEVNAWNGSATTAWSSVWSFSTMIGSPTLSSPANGATLQPTALTLNWGAVSAAASYGVEVSTSSSFSGTVFSQTGLTSPSVMVSGLSNSQLYYWSANAANAGGTGNWSAVWSFTTIMAIAGVPQLSSPANGNTGLSIPVVLMWQSAIEAASYGVEVGTSLSFGAGTTVFNQTGITGTSVSVGNLVAGQTYYWQVDAWNNAGAGLWSQIWDFGTAGTSTLAHAKAGLNAGFSINGEALEYSLLEPGDVEISFSDLLGRTALAMKRTLPAGHYAMSLKECSLAAGRYIVHFKAAGIERREIVLIER